ncbi:unnamed protein product [Gongylonema pulchrum]|uniref:Neur_chan_memb domain-containing protein n=1 Tax=Gongylonema pulchrum TaxID=637853 RepID=A0A183E6Q8_9BILA|nr:unnamed protein product [Gongylonema pulchrum]
METIDNLMRKSGFRGHISEEARLKVNVVRTVADGFAYLIISIIIIIIIIRAHSFLHPSIMPRYLRVEFIDGLLPQSL